MRHGLFARGNGEYWLDESGFYFRKYLTKGPISIPFDSILEIKLGKFHAGRWCMGNPILKIIWRKDNLRLSSGFLVSKYKKGSEELKTELENMITR